MSSLFAHIDADLLVYRCGFACEKNHWFIRHANGESLVGAPEDYPTVEEFQYKKEVDARLEELFEGSRQVYAGEHYDIWSTRNVEPVENALHNVKLMVANIVDSVQPDEYRLYLSGPTNFRDGIAKSAEYKGNRDKAHKPTHADAIKLYMHEHYDVWVSEGEEADDLIGTEHYSRYRKAAQSSVIVSVDKDLRMIPGMHYDFLKDEFDIVDEETALRSFYLQLLTGDSTDNIPGLPKVGPVKARKILDGLPPEEWEWVVQQEYMSRIVDRNWFDYLREQGQLLWIRREPGELWEPQDLGGEY